MRYASFVLLGVSSIGCRADPSDSYIWGASETLGDGDGDGDGDDDEEGGSDGTGDGDGDGTGDGDGDGEGDGDGDGDGDPDGPDYDSCAYVGAAPVWHLDGAAAPPEDSCEDFTLTATVYGGDAISWDLQNCPCGLPCPPDPYELKIYDIFEYGSLDLGTCVTIETIWNVDCTVGWALIRDSTDGSLRLALRGGPLGPVTAALPELTVSDTGSVIDCGDYDAREVAFTIDDQTVELWHGQQATVETSMGSFTITNIDSRDEPNAAPVSSWIVVRNGL